MPKVETKSDLLVQRFKKSGKFDMLRKKIVNEFSSSIQGQDLYEALCELAANSKQKHQPMLIGELGQSKLFRKAEKQILQSTEFLGNLEFKASIKKELKTLYEESMEEELKSVENGETGEIVE